MADLIAALPETVSQQRAGVAVAGWRGSGDDVAVSTGRFDGTLYV
jgi:hypothetical protein